MLASNSDLDLLPQIAEAVALAYPLLGIHKPAATGTSDDFAALRADWERLHPKSDAGIFLSWAWLYPWYTHLAPTRKLHIVTLRNTRGGLDGILPLSLEGRPLLGTRLGPSIRRMSFLGETHVGSDYLDVIAHHANRDSITRTLFQSVRDSANWDVLDLNDMLSTSPTIPILRDIFPAAEYTIETTEGPACPYEQFSPNETFGTFIKNLGRGSNYKRRRKWLEKQPGFRIERATEPHEMPHALTEFLRLHDLRWRDDGGSDGITCPATEAFHREAATYLAQNNNIYLYTMFVGDNAVASFYALTHNGKMICYLTGRDPEWHSQSVGMVLIGETFRDALESGMSEYDFLRGEEPYKSDWSTHQRTLTNIRIYRNNSRGSWLTRQERALKSARRLARKLLPAPLLNKLRRIC